MEIWTGTLSVKLFWSGEIHRMRLAEARLRSSMDSLCSHLYSHTAAAFAPEWQLQADIADSCAESLSAATEHSFNESSRSLKKLQIGTSVDVQDARTKRWSKRGVIVAIGKHRDYFVKLPSGRVYWRNRRFSSPVRSPYCCCCCSTCSPCFAGTNTTTAQHPCPSTNCSSEHF